MKDSEARALAARLAAGFPAKRPEAGTMALYVETLLPYDVEIGQRAVRNLIDTETYLPAVSILRLELRDLQRMDRPARLALGEGEWTKADEAKAAEVGHRLIRAFLDRPKKAGIEDGE